MSARQPAGHPEGNDAAAGATASVFRAMLDAMPTLAWTAQADGSVDWCNARWYAYTGTTPAEMDGWGWQRVHDPVTLPAVLARWTAVLATGQASEMTFRLRGADGVYRDFLTRVAPLRTATPDGTEGPVTRWFGTNTDLTPERAAAGERERLLAVSEATRTALEAANVRLRAHEAELETANQQLQEQAAELEATAEVLQTTAADLEAEIDAAEIARGVAEAERARAQAILESTADAYFLLDREWRIVDVNTAMTRGSDRTRTDLLGRDFWTTFPGTVETVFERAYRGVVAGGGPRHFTHDYSDGRLDLVVEVDAYPGPDGGVAVFWRDVTARARADAAIRASEARYRALLDALDVGFCVLELVMDEAGQTVDWRFLETNRAFVEQVPYGDPAGRRMREIAPDLDPFWFAFYGGVAATGAPARVTQDAVALGRVYDVFAYRVDDPARRHVAVLFTDVTARRLDEQTRDRLLTEAEHARMAADAANQAKSQFLANMSHELRTPLNAIGGYVQLLEMGLHGPVTDAQRGALGRVQQAQTRLLALINDVLNYAKLEGGKVEYDVEAVDVADVVRDVAPLIEPQFRAAGLAFEVRLPETACVVWADRAKLGQVLVNLLSNAGKFTPSPHPTTGQPGRVLVTVASRTAGADGGRPALAFLRVQDTGIGIPRAKQDAIFEPFVQVRTGYAQATDGTGLGLAISRDLARGMGGDLRVRSREGEGATFTVSLRRVVDAAGHSADRRASPKRRSVPRAPTDA